MLAVRCFIGLVISRVLLVAAPLLLITAARYCAISFIWISRQRHYAKLSCGYSHRESLFHVRH